METETFLFNSAKEKFICEQLSQLKKPREVVQAYNDSHRDKITTGAVVYYQYKRSDLIRNMRENMLMNVMDIPIANEKVRLNRAETLYHEAQKINAVKDKVETSLKCLDFAREETRTETPQSLSMQFNQYNELTNEQLLEKKRDIEKRLMAFKKEEVIDAKTVD